MIVLDGMHILACNYLIVMMRSRNLVHVLFVR